MDGNTVWVVQNIIKTTKSTKFSFKKTGTITRSCYYGSTTTTRNRRKKFSKEPFTRKEKCISRELARKKAQYGIETYDGI